jgi:hypothetical protein
MAWGRHATRPGRDQGEPQRRPDDAAVERLELPPVEQPWRIYFCEDVARGVSAATPLQEAGVILRARHRPDRKDDSTIKLRPGRRRSSPTTGSRPRKERTGSSRSRPTGPLDDGSSPSRTPPTAPTTSWSMPATDAGPSLATGRRPRPGPRDRRRCTARGRRGRHPGHPGGSAARVASSRKLISRSITHVFEASGTRAELVSSAARAATGRCRLLAGEGCARASGHARTRRWRRATRAVVVPTA